jgi:hypothetical protein
MSLSARFMVPLSSIFTAPCMAVLSICIAGAADEGWLCAEAKEAIPVVSAQTERVANATSRVDVMEVSFDSGAV